MVENCKVCLKHKVNRPEPLSPTPFPERPWQELGMDFFQCQSLDYLIIIDYYSRFIEIAAMNKSKRGSEAVRCLKSMFSRHGIPEKVRSDNGPPFDSAEYAKFANDWGFMISTSSPKFPKSNGEAERAVQTTKSILKKGQNQAKALLAYRATPLACGYSPAQLLMGRNIRSTVPTFPAQLKPQLPIWRYYIKEKMIADCSNRPILIKDIELLHCRHCLQALKYILPVMISQEQLLKKQILQDLI